MIAWRWRFVGIPARTRVALVSGVALLGLLALVGTAGMLFAPAVRAGDEGDVASVQVINFPETQQVDGQVRIKGPLPLAEMMTVRDVEVPPSLIAASARAVAAGTITTDGFGAVVLSLSSAPQGFILKTGEVGALLIPDEEAILEVFEKKGLTPFALELKADCARGAALCTSIPSRQIVAFPRYRVFLHNTTDRTARADLFAYLTN